MYSKITVLAFCRVAKLRLSQHSAFKVTKKLSMRALSSNYLCGSYLTQCHNAPTRPYKNGWYIANLGHYDGGGRYQAGGDAPVELSGIFSLFACHSAFLS
jgi:hypothetical protein